MSRYHETKRQQYLDNLLDKRNKAEKTALQQIDANFMSGEEDDEGSQEDVWVVRSPPWRSPQLSSLIKRLQEKIDNQPFESSSSHPQNTRRRRRKAIHMLFHILEEYGSVSCDFSFAIRLISHSVGISHTLLPKRTRSIYEKLKVTFGTPV